VIATEEPRFAKPPPGMLTGTAVYTFRFQLRAVLKLNPGSGKKCAD